MIQYEFKSLNKFVYTPASASVISATPRADARIYRSSCSQSARWSKRAMNFSVAGDCTSFAALAMVPTYLFVTYRLSGTLDRLRKLDMVQHCKWIAYGLGGKGCTSMRPKLHLPVLGHAFRITGFMA